MTTRHKWPKDDEAKRTEHRTERLCSRCDLMRVTVHEGPFPWVEWWRDGVQIVSDKTPACDARLEWATGEFE